LSAGTAGNKNLIDLGKRARLIAVIYALGFLYPVFIFGWLVPVGLGLDRLVKKNLQASFLSLFSNAERAKDQVEDVVGGGRTGDRVQWAQRVVEIEQ